MPDQASEPRLDETLARAAGGDAEAWRALVEAYSRRVYALLVRQCGDRELAEEITQATFVKVVTRIDRYREQGRFEPWLFRIAMNALRDEMRRRQRQARPTDMSGDGRLSDDAAGGAGSSAAWAAAEPHLRDRAGGGGALQEEGPFEHVSRGEQIELLRAAVAQLPPADQEILALRHTAGLSFAQIAETLGQPLGTVLARGHRALGKLRKMLGPADTDASPPGDKASEREGSPSAAKERSPRKRQNHEVDHG